MSFIFKCTGALGLLCATTLGGWAQNIGNSPFSRLGIGDLAPVGNVRQAGMAYTGISAPQNDFINLANPALLYHSRLTVLESGLLGQYKELSSQNNTVTGFNGSLNYLGMALPITKQGALRVGFNPYSTVNYDIATELPVTNLPDVRYEDRRQGRGGLNQVVIGYGHRLGSGFSAGLEASYLFGNSQTQTLLRLAPTLQNPTNTLYTTQRRLTQSSGFMFKPGLAYRKELSKLVFINLGATYELPAVLGAERSVEFLRTTGEGSLSIPLPGDTLQRQDGQLRLPARYGFGLSFDKPYAWTLAADFRYEPWSDFSELDNDGGLGNAYRAALGAEWIPDITSVGNYLKRVTYRAGTFYEQTPLLVRGNQLEDFGINLGMTLPVNKNLSGINLAMIFGQRGQLETGLLRERYWRIALGFNVNERWFQRYRVD